MKAELGIEDEAYQRRSRPETPGDDARGIDLMRSSAVRSLVLWSGFPRTFQWVMLAAFIALIVIAWGAFTPPGVNDKLFAKTHLATLLVWGIWWPLMVWVAVGFGRAWCVVCPLELVGSLGEGLARTVRMPGRALPRWISSGAIILALFVGIQMLVPGVHLHRVPSYTAYFLISLITIAILAGFAFRDRAMCRGFCPVGLLLNSYGRGGMLAVRPGRQNAGTATARPDARSCPSLLNPSRINSNADCLGCAHCFKGATPGSMRLLLRWPFSQSDAREPLASWPITGFVVLVSGFVVSELCSEWPAAKKVFLGPPQWVTTQLGWSAGGGWIEGIWTLGVVPAVLWLTLGGVLRLSGEKAPMVQLWQRLALPAAIVIAAGHMSKGLAKFVSWIPFLPGAWRDPDGVDTSRAIAQKAMSVPTPWMSLPMVSWVGVVLVVAAAVFAIREYHLARRGKTGSSRGAFPLVLLAACFGVLVFGWRYA